jgi:hypothetical protein
MKPLTTPILLTLALFVAGVVADVGATQNKGADKMVLDGGSRGSVPFPHHQHQTVAENCGVCHDSFPQETGSIQRLKTQGELAGKQVMNKLCINCHRSAKRAGKKAGPLTCSDCHVKE